MPSFRAQLEILALHPGQRPEAVMDTAVAVLGSLHLVEANQLDIVAGIPRITLRFLVDPADWEAESRQATRAALSMRHAVSEVADVGRLRILRRRRGRWEPV